ncbi:Holo-ACP synthase [Candidatus Hepatincolaceae symbiont of Richtersius coronifer]
MIIRNGVDMVDIARINKTYNQFYFKFIERIFTEREQHYCTRNNIINFNALAKRFAAKEAFAKALGNGIGYLAFRDIEILNDSYNAPYINLTPKILDYIKDLYGWHNLAVSLSLTDDKDLALAFVTLYNIN